MSDGLVYSAQEFAVIDPRLWLYWLNIGVKIPVLIYDASAPDDNTLAPTCNTPQK